MQSISLSNTAGSTWSKERHDLGPGQQGHTPLSGFGVEGATQFDKPDLDPLDVSPVAGLRILIVEADAVVQRACREIAAQCGFEVLTASFAAEAYTLLQRHAIDVALIDIGIAGGMSLLEELRERYPQSTVVVSAAFASVHSVVEAMRLGANDYLTKPFAMDELVDTLRRAGKKKHVDTESHRLRERLRTQIGLGGIIGKSPEMQKIYRILSKVAFTTHPVLILGESGTGKEKIARAIHNYGNQKNKPFVVVDCGALVPTLIESELFGHAKGAFTGANQNRVGLLASAEGGTVFLDEVGELPLDLQTRLLRALQEREVRPIGSTQAVPIKARVLAATNRDLVSMVEQGRFRKDLYFRLNVVNLKIPPLRARREDILLLAAQFLERMRRENDVQYVFSDEALRVMDRYDWPGNVRELENAIERACVLSSGPVIHMADLPTQLQDFRRHMDEDLVRIDERVASEKKDVVEDLEEEYQGVITLAALEKQAILKAIQQLHGDKLMAAKLLGIGKTTLYRKLKEYGLEHEVEDEQ